MRKLVDIITPAESPSGRSIGHFRFRLTEAWPFTLIFDDGTRYEGSIPIGFVGDLFSSPWIAQFFVPKSQGSDKGAWLHDWLFATVGLRKTAKDEPLVSLAQANWAMAYVNAKERVNVFQRWFLKTGVNLGGWIPWNDYRRAGHSLTYPKMS